MCLQVLRVSGMPFNVKVWVVDHPEGFTVYIDKKLISKHGAAALQEIFRSTVTGWRRLDETFVLHTLQAVTG